MASFAVRSSGVLVSLSLLVLSGCPGGRNPIEPQGGTASGALGEATCHAVGPRDQPLVVDWKAHERSNLEEAMADGVAVVHYDCGSLRVLPGCHIEGSYGFLPTSRKEQVVKLESADDIAANLPAFGKSLAKSFSASLDRGSSLDLAMVLVGKRRTTVSEAGKSVLRGGAACEGATHFVRGAFVGAFALGTGTRGQASTVAYVVEANSKSSTLAGYRDGDVTACKVSREDDTRAPSGCAALVRLELIAIDDAGAGSGETTCPDGLVMVGGKCTKSAQSSPPPRLCREDDVADCTAQCEKKHLPSCTRLGRLYQDGKGVPANPRRAAELFERACESGYTKACGSLGYLYGEGVGVAEDKARAASLFQRACDSAEPEPIACVNLGTYYKLGAGSVVKDEARAAAIYRKACDGGEPVGCFGLGGLYAEGNGVPQDELRATALFKQSCDGGFAGGCHNTGSMYESGRGVAANVARAIEYYKKGCAAKDEESCASLDYFHVKH